MIKVGTITHCQPGSNTTNDQGWYNNRLPACLQYNQWSRLVQLHTASLFPVQPMIKVGTITWLPACFQYNQWSRLVQLHCQPGSNNTNDQGWYNNRLPACFQYNQWSRLVQLHCQPGSSITNDQDWYNNRLPAWFQYNQWSRLVQ